MPSKDYDWRSNIKSRGWPYKGDIDDPKYLKERSELFAKSGNGWWWYTSGKINKIISEEMKRKKTMKEENLNVKI